MWKELNNGAFKRIRTNSTSNWASFDNALEDRPSVMEYVYDGDDDVINTYIWGDTDRTILWYIEATTYFVHGVSGKQIERVDKKYYNTTGETLTKHKIDVYTYDGAGKLQYIYRNNG